MQTVPEVADMVAQASKANVQWSAVLKRAGIASTTAWRWRRGEFHPRYATLTKLRDALAAEIAGADGNNESHPMRAMKAHSPNRRAGSRGGVRG